MKNYPDDYTLKDAAKFSDQGVDYYNQDNLEAALEQHQKALDIRQKKAPDSLNLANSYIAISNIYESQGNLAAALEQYQKALDIKQRKAPDSLELASSYHNIGNIYESQGNLTAAIEQFGKSLNIKERTTPDSLDLVPFYHNIGFTYISQGNLAAANEQYQKALDIQKRKAPDSLDLASSCNHMGDVYQYMGNSTAAFEQYRKALDIRQRKAPDSFELSVSYNNIGNVYASLGNLTAALEHFQKAIELEPKCDSAYNNRGVAYNINGQHDLALIDCSKAIELAPEIGYGYKNRAFAYKGLGKNDLAMTDFIKSQELFKKSGAQEMVKKMQVEIDMLQSALENKISVSEPLVPDIKTTKALEHETVGQPTQTQQMLPIQPVLKLPTSLQASSLNRLVKQKSQSPEVKGIDQESSQTITSQDAERIEFETISFLSQQQDSQGNQLESLTQDSSFSAQAQLKKLQYAEAETLKKEEANFKLQEEAIRKEIATELEKLNATNAKLQSELFNSQSKTEVNIELIKLQILQINSQITALTTNQQILLTAHQKQQQLTKEKNQIVSNPLTFIFYNTVLKNLETTLLSYRLTSGGIVERKASGGLKTVTQTIDFIGGAIPVPGVGFVAGLVNLGIKKVEETTFKKKEQAIDDLTSSISQIQELAERTARALTLRYEEQIGNLTPASSAQLAKIAVQNIVIETYTKQNERFIIESLMEALKEAGSDLIETESTIVDASATTILTTILASEKLAKSQNKLVNYITGKFRQLKTPQEKQQILDAISARSAELNLNQETNQQSAENSNSEINQMERLIDKTANDLISIVLKDHQDNLMDYLDRPGEMLKKKFQEGTRKVARNLLGSETEAKVEVGMLGKVRAYAKTENDQVPITTNSKITARWTAKGIFQDAGIKTREGEYYSATGTAMNSIGQSNSLASKPATYGYRLGTKEEAQKLNLSSDPYRIRSEVNEISLTKATNQQVRNLGDDSKGVKQTTELLAQQLKQTKDVQAEQDKQRAKQEKETKERQEEMRRKLSLQGRQLLEQAQEREREKAEREEMRRRLSLQGKQMAELTQKLSPKLSSHHESDSEEFDEETLKEAIESNFCSKIKELNLEDKIGAAADWQIIKHAKKDAFKLVLNIPDFQKRSSIKNELSSRNIDVKIDIIKKTISIENIDGNNLDELLVKLESNPKIVPSPSPSNTTVSRAAQKQDSIVNEL